MSGQDNLAGAMDAGQIERLTRYLALKGEAEVARLLAIGQRAHALLADPAFADTITAAEKAAVPAAFAWEAEEVFPVGTPVSLYLASVENFATGEGLTIYFAAAAAAARLRARHRRPRAVPAVVRDACVEGSARCIRTGQRPATFRFFARHHANYS